MLTLRLPFCVRDCQLITNPFLFFLGTQREYNFQLPLQWKVSKNDVGCSQIWPVETSHRLSFSAARYWHVE